MVPVGWRRTAVALTVGRIRGREGDRNEAQWRTAKPSADSVGGDIAVGTHLPFGTGQPPEDVSWTHSARRTAARDARPPGRLRAFAGAIPNVAGGVVAHSPFL